MPVQEAKWPAVGEPGDVADVGQDPGRAGRADAVQVHQAASRVAVDAPRAVRPCIALSLASMAHQLGEFLGGQPPAACVRTRSRGRTVASSALALRRRNFFAGAPPGSSSSSSRCSRFRLWARARGQFIAAVDQQPQHHQVARRQSTCTQAAAVAQGDHHDRVRVGGVGLAALPGVEHPHPRGQLRRHVQHRLAVGEQPLRERPADAVSALDRPHPPRPLPAAACSIAR